MAAHRLCILMSLPLSSPLSNFVVRWQTAVVELGLDLRHVFNLPSDGASSTHQKENFVVVQQLTTASAVYYKYIIFSIINILFNFKLHFQTYCRSFL